MNQPSTLWKTAYDMGVTGLTGERLELLECRRQEIARDLAHVAMSVAGWTGDPGEIAAAEEFAEQLIRDGVVD